MTCGCGPFGLEIQVSSIEDAVLCWTGGYQAMKRMQHVESNHLLARKLRI